jgi:sigma-E factor negative regulatory protein RseC
MSQGLDHTATPGGETTIEAVAKVVAFEHGLAVLEPEPTGSCNGCMSAALCGTKTGNTSRLLAKRFTLADNAGLRIGDRVVVGLGGGSLMRASITAYAIPLLTMLVAMVTIDQLGGGETRTMVGTVVGLGVGIVIARLTASYLAKKGDLTPRFIRRAYGPGPGESCHTDLG